MSTGLDSQSSEFNLQGAVPTGPAAETSPLHSELQRANEALKAQLAAARAEIERHRQRNQPEQGASDKQVEDDLNRLEGIQAQLAGECQPRSTAGDSPRQSYRDVAAKFEWQEEEVMDAAQGVRTGRVGCDVHVKPVETQPEPEPLVERSQEPVARQHQPGEPIVVPEVVAEEPAAVEQIEPDTQETPASETEADDVAALVESALTHREIPAVKPSDQSVDEGQPAEIEDTEAEVVGGASSEAASRHEVDDETEPCGEEDSIEDHIAAFMKRMRSGVTITGPSAPDARRRKRAAATAQSPVAEPKPAEVQQSSAAAKSAPTVVDAVQVLAALERRGCADVTDLAAMRALANTHTRLALHTHNTRQLVRTLCMRLFGAALCLLAGIIGLNLTSRTLSGFAAMVIVAGIYFVFLASEDAKRVTDYLKTRPASGEGGKEFQLAAIVKLVDLAADLRRRIMPVVERLPGWRRVEKLWNDFRQ